MQIEAMFFTLPFSIATKQVTISLNDKKFQPFCYLNFCYLNFFEFPFCFSRTYREYYLDYYYGKNNGGFGRLTKKEDENGKLIRKEDGSGEQEQEAEDEEEPEKTTKKEE